ncbi:alpha/beta hydrolase [Marinobacter sp. CHS3-4]|uniref:alpha/beta hydrolase n=1 Tax=Marinobacter sp. CHS3-4 TaxID=3045174 RepID=UPI0024B608B1|nr:alpha/beta hydrolase [Marinobacter sp. CHS3-4]MDI9244199.1 alpha/beta hydrolase [Marinobacter sp. CHS3-4]
MNRISIFLFSFFFALPISYAEEIVFRHNQNSLSGHYLGATNGKPAKAVLLFVHGDGATSYDAKGYYSHIWEPLRKHGYAIFSWDKPNVGNSTGNWLEQSMADRQSEVLTAINYIQNKYNFASENTGLFGFSQAGWALPALANKNSKVGFVIGIGFSKNWVEQGRYYTKIRHELAGKNQKQISSELNKYAKEVSFFKSAPSYNEYLQYSGEVAMIKERYQFVLKNFMSDATHDYGKINVPSLFLWGEKDLSVNAKNEFKWWQVHGSKLVTPKLISNASHSMLNADSFSEQDFGYKEWIKLMWLEQDAFAKDFLPTILTWLEKRKL